ncbi:energy-coupling factor ABC transporter ATP-binding protein [Corynebacterium sp. CCM 9185]|uniref:energy-coupling factor ABC transporter ATP-binding protein n=1 Tax=Corynebacterium marambiense TaxID=2765364 RepID=UPI002006C040|nr:ABC transporter ATP-binding protein [Corynebacterium marambiense]MCK7664384.1 energy-coupling factor ABC transporter ATP-binding protein [Corynebacterium marambiense]MCX7543197.1 ABC transporter ATP-binding protein [Corynebacterium marambiense]
MTHPTPPLVELSDVDFSHGPDLPVLRSVDLRIRAGDRIAVLGANGSGKSTLFRLLAAAWKPDHGELRVDGEPVRYNRAGRDRVRRRVQLVLQEPDDQIFATSVSADIAYGPVNMGLDHHEVKRRVNEAMTAAEVVDLADRVPHQLSYGQRKRVALAGALAMDPAVLLLDEPTAGLDPAGGRQLLLTLAALNAKGTAVVLSTHDVDLAYAFADTAVVLTGGTIFSGNVEDVLTDRDLMERARLGLPWAPLVSRALGRKISAPEELPESREYP